MAALSAKIAFSLSIATGCVLAFSAGCTSGAGEPQPDATTDSSSSVGFVPPSTAAGGGNPDAIPGMQRLEPDPGVLAAAAQDTAAGQWTQRFPDMGMDPRALKSIDDALSEVLEALTSDYLGVRIEGIRTLGRMEFEPISDRSADVVQILMAQRGLDFNDIEDEAIDLAMKSLGEKILPEVKRLSKSEQIRELSDACEAMRSLGSDFFPQLRETLQWMLASKNPARIWGAMYALETMGPPAAELLPSVRPFLNDPDFQNQIIALRALAAIGPGAKEYFEIVRDLTDDGQNVSVRSHAVRTLGYISQGDEALADQATAAILSHLDDFPFMVKVRGLEGLIALRELATPAQEKAQSLLNDRSGLAPSAAMVYGYTSGDWNTSLDILKGLIPDLIVGAEVLNNLRELGPIARPLVDDLLKVAATPDVSVSIPAIEALAAQVKLDNAEDWQALTDEDKMHLNRLAAGIAPFTENGDAELQWKARSIVDRWKAAGWVPPQTEESQTEESQTKESQTEGQ